MSTHRRLLKSTLGCMTVIIPSSLSQRIHYHANRTVIPGASDFSIFLYFLHIQPAIFQVSNKAVILSEAHRRSIANSVLYGAESKSLS